MTTSAVNAGAGALFTGNMAKPKAPNVADGKSFSMTMSETGKNGSQGQELKQEGTKLQNEKTEPKANMEKPKQVNKSPEEKAEKPVENQTAQENVAEAQPSEVTDAQIEEAMSVLAQGAMQILQQVAEILEVEPQQVIQSLEELDMNLTDLLKPESIQELMASIKGDDAKNLLLTDENFYTQVQDVLQNAEDVLLEAQDLTNLNEEVMSEIITRMDQVLTRDANVSPVEENLVVQMNADTTKQVDAPKYEEVTPLQNLSMGQEEESLSLSHLQIVKETKLDQKELHGNTRGENPFAANLFAQNPLNQVAEGFGLDKVSTPMMPSATEVMEQITDYMRMQATQDMTELTMQLNPEHLGTLHISLTSKEGVMTAQFTTQNENVRAVIQSQILDLRQALEDQGIKVEAVEVNVATSFRDERRGFAGEGENGQNKEFGGQKKRSRKIDLSLLADDPAILDALTGEDKLTAEMMQANGGTVDYTA